MQDHPISELMAMCDAGQRAEFRRLFRDSGADVMGGRLRMLAASARGPDPAKSRTSAVERPDPKKVDLFGTSGPGRRSCRGLARRQAEPLTVMLNWARRGPLNMTECLQR